MGVRLKTPFRTRVKGGGVLTFAGTAAKQAVYWFLAAIDPREGYGPWPSVGGLRRPRYRVSTVRYGTGFRYGEGIPYDGMVRWYSDAEVDDHITMTDASLRATVIYLAPDHPPRIRYGMLYKFGEVKWGQESGLYDRITAKVVLD